MVKVRVTLMLALVVGLVVCQTAALAQNLGAAPQFDKAVLGQNGAMPEGTFRNIINWVGNVIAPVGAGGAVVGGIVQYAMGRGAMRWFATAGGLLLVSGLTRMIEFFVTNATGI